MDRTALLAALDSLAPKPRAVEVPDLGTVYVRRLSAADVDAQLQYKALHEKDMDFAPTLFALCQRICGPNGEAIFDPWKAEDREAVGRIDTDSDALASLIVAMRQRTNEGN